jgi:hypothetical protein
MAVVFPDPLSPMTQISLLMGGLLKFQNAIFPNAGINICERFIRFDADVAVVPIYRLIFVVRAMNAGNFTIWEKYGVLVNSFGIKQHFILFHFSTSILALLTHSSQKM